MSGNAYQLATLMLVTTSAGLTMFFAGSKKRMLRWRDRRGGRRRLFPRPKH